MAEPFVTGLSAILWKSEIPVHLSETKSKEVRAVSTAMISFLPVLSSGEAEGLRKVYITMNPPTWKGKLRIISVMVFSKVQAGFHLLFYYPLSTAEQPRSILRRDVYRSPKASFF